MAVVREEHGLMTVSADEQIQIAHNEGTPTVAAFFQAYWTGSQPKGKLEIRNTRSGAVKTVKLDSADLNSSIFSILADDPDWEENDLYSFTYSGKCSSLTLLSTAGGAVVFNGAGQASANGVQTILQISGE